MIDHRQKQNTNLGGDNKCLAAFPGGLDHCDPPCGCSSISVETLSLPASQFVQFVRLVFHSHNLFRTYIPSYFSTLSILNNANAQANNAGAIQRKMKTSTDRDNGNAADACYRSKSSASIEEGMTKGEADLLTFLRHPDQTCQLPPPHKLQALIRACYLAYHAYPT